MTLPVEAEPLLAVLLPHFTRPTATRFVTLLVAAVLTPGRRTVANLLRTLGPLARGHRTTYQRVLSRVPWSTAALGTALAGFLLRHPDRRVACVGDSGFGTHEVARFCRRRDRLTLVSKLHPDAHLFDPPGRRPRVGRPPVKGAGRRKPREAVACTRRLMSLRVDRYGGGTRRVSTVTASAHWYKAGHGLVPVRWVHVRDRTATHRDEYLYTTDPTLRPAEVVGRWNLETTRGWGRATVLRAAPLLFGLYSVVAPLYHALPRENFNSTSGK